MFSCIIIDDEQNAREALQKLIQRYFPDKMEVVELAESVENGVLAINKYHPDIVFLDIEMPNEDGFKLFDYFKNVNFEVIFTTAYEHYAIDAFKTSAMAYLLKPINYVDLQTALKQFETEHHQKSKHQRLETLLGNLNAGKEVAQKIALPTMTGYQMVKVHHIIYCQSESNYTRIFVLNEPDILVTKTLKLVAELLPEDMFFRIHKSYHINLNFVKQYVNLDGHFIILDDGTRLDVAFRRVDEFVKVLTGQNLNSSE